MATRSRSTGSRAAGHPNSHGQASDSIHDSLSSMGDLIRKEVKRELSAARDAASNVLEKGRESAEQMRDGLADRVRERPLVSVLAAAGVGLLAGLLLARRRTK